MTFTIDFTVPSTMGYNNSDCWRRVRFWRVAVVELSHKVLVDVALHPR